MPEETGRAVILPRLARGILVMGLLSFLFGCGSKESPFQQKDEAWYYHSTLIEGADAKTFEPLSDHYARDKGRSEERRVGKECRL